MPSIPFNPDWYGPGASVVARDGACTVIDYGCPGKGLVKSYQLFDGVQICFLDFETDAVLPSQTFNVEILEVTCCRGGRYESEYADHTVSYLPEGCFSVAGTARLPVSFSFPLGKYAGTSLVVDGQALSASTRWLLEAMAIDPAQIRQDLGTEKSCYVSAAPEELQDLFDGLDCAGQAGDVPALRLGALELLRAVARLTPAAGCDAAYFDKKQIQKVKEIRTHLISHLDEKVPLETLVRQAHMNLSNFYMVFAHIYGESPYAYLKRYKMNLAAQMLAQNKRKIGDIAQALGYSNASKFAKAFFSVYGVLPKDYRKKG